jgi:hypothetical protein
VVKFTTTPLCPQDPRDRRMGEYQSRCGRKKFILASSGKQKFLAIPTNRTANTKASYPKPSHYSNASIPTPPKRVVLCLCSTCCHRHLAQVRVSCALSSVSMEEGMGIGPKAFELNFKLISLDTLSHCTAGTNYWPTWYA